MKRQTVVRLSLVAAGVLSACAINAGEIRAANDPNVIPNRYIVVYKDDAVTVATRGAINARALSEGHRRQFGADVKQVFEHALKGAVVVLDHASAQKLADDPAVAFVEQDRIVRLQATQTGATWGLDRIDQNDLPLNSSYTYPTGGSTVHAYIIDTGVYTAHSNFGGRIGNGYDAIGGGTGDCQGHGTHVAGTVGSTTYGVAKSVVIHPVRVLGCDGSGSVSGIVAGFDWVRANHVKPAVANASLGGGASSAMDTAASNLVAAGVTTVVAAGNDNSNACNYSPARASGVITVGSTDSSDNRSSFSNYGSCVEIYAPGSNITSTSRTGSTTSMSGTSMASPHVAGAAALYLAANPSATPSQVGSALINNGTSNTINGIPSGANKMLNISFLNGTTPPPPPPPPPPPGGGSLTNGVPVSNLGTSTGQWLHYTLVVPSGASNLRFTSSGGSGDADMFVRFGAQPSSSVYDCKSEGSSNSETCNIPTAQAGTYHVSLYAYSSFSGASLTGAYTTGGGGGGCSGLPQWNANTYYNAGDKVQYNGRQYQARYAIWYWSPVYSAYWTDLGACS